MINIYTSTLVFVCASCKMFVSGTLGYVMSQVEDGKPFSEVVKAAKSLGFTEPGFYVILNLHLNYILDS